MKKMFQQHPSKKKEKKKKKEIAPYHAHGSQGTSVVRRLDTSGPCSPAARACWGRTLSHWLLYEGPCCLE